VTGAATKGSAGLISGATATIAATAAVIATAAANADVSAVLIAATNAYP